MRLFDFDPADLAPTYRTRGWVHVRRGATPEFLAHLQEYVRAQASAAVLRGTGIAGAKEQHLYDPPPEVDLVGELCALAQGACGLEPASFALAERHIKHYAPDADPAPTAHKDRLASQVSIGVSIEVPAGSHVVLWPDVDRGVNPFLTADLSQSLAPGQHPDVVLAGAPGVEIYDEPGDVMMFPGSAVWHLRRQSANTVNLYLKCNDFDCDPLAEDPSTERRRLDTADLLARAGAGALTSTTPVLSRRLEWAGTLSARDGERRAAAKMWDRPLAFISESQLALLERLGARGPHGAGAASGNGAAASADDIVDLARRGIVDLVGARQPEPAR